MNQSTHFLQEISSATRPWDWRSVCDHLVERVGNMHGEMEHFGAVFSALSEVFGEERAMAVRLSKIILTSEDYEDVPDYQQTAIHRGCECVQACISTMHGQYAELSDKVRCTSVTSREVY